MMGVPLTDIIGIQEPGERYCLDCAYKEFGHPFMDALLNYRIDVEVEEEDGERTIRDRPFPEIIEQLEKLGGTYNHWREIWQVPGDWWELGKVFGHHSFGSITPGYPDPGFDNDEWTVLFEGDTSDEPWNFVCGLCHEYMTEFEPRDYSDVPVSVIGKDTLVEIALDAFHDLLGILDEALKDAGDESFIPEITEAVDRVVHNYSNSSEIRDELERAVEDEWNTLLRRYYVEGKRGDNLWKEEVI